MPKLYAREERPNHPYLEDYRSSLCYDDFFTGEANVQRALAGYFGLVSYLDDNIGKLMQTLEETGLAETTNVLYTSDHGDNLGARGLWGKSTMYEESAGVPLIIAGPGVPKGQVIDTPVSHVDCLPTILNMAGAVMGADAASFPGIDLVEIAAGAKPDRVVLSEYHAMGSTTGAFMVRLGRFKYVYYAKYQPQLFDLQADPEELHDLGTNPAYAAVIQDCHARLLELCDPDEIDRIAKARQAMLIETHGGHDAVLALAEADFAFSPPPGAATTIGSK